MKVTRKEFLGLVAAGSAGTLVAPKTAAIAAEATTRKAEKADIQGSTAAVARFIRRATLADIPPDAVAQARRCLVDGFGVILAGSTVQGSAIVRDYVKAGTDRRDASILGTKGVMSSVASAALANGASGHAMDFDDTQLSTTPDRTYGLLTHPTLPPLCAALAVGEHRNVSGAAFLEAFLVGFEVECKIAEAIDPAHYTKGFHSSGTIGTFGAAAAAARLMNLDEKALAHMLAIASSVAAGIRVNFGSMTKPLHVGRAAENGVFAADLAARGFTGGDDGLDGEWGFFQVLGGGADLDRLNPILGRPWSIVQPGVSVKPYPSGVLSHPSMDAMLKIVVDRNLKPEQVKAVRLRAGSNILQPLRYKTAKTELEAKFCVPFLLTSILLRRRAGVREFTDEFVSSPQVQQTMERVTTVFDPRIEAQGFDKIRSIVEVDLVSGETVTQPSDDAYRGGPDRPFTREELHAKFTDCAQLTMAADRIPAAIAAIEGVQTSPSIRTLIAALQ
ncbi:MAG TPA: MmgE/PrpD family protein [Vicinamibacterales bacterium]|nr:MmgE/PrpD family protein [Vicinamibacterales bacterium]